MPLSKGGTVHSMVPVGACGTGLTEAPQGPPRDMRTREVEGELKRNCTPTNVAQRQHQPPSWQQSIRKPTWAPRGTESTGRTQHPTTNSISKQHCTKVDHSSSVAALHSTVTLTRRHHITRSGLHSSQETGLGTRFASISAACPALSAAASAALHASSGGQSAWTCRPLHPSDKGQSPAPPCPRQSARWHRRSASAPRATAGWAGRWTDRTKGAAEGE